MFGEALPETAAEAALKAPASLIEQLKNIPDNIFVLVQSVQRGWRLGLAVVLGLCLGIVGHTAAVALGLTDEQLDGLFELAATL